MAIQLISFEGITNGTPLTAANTGFTSQAGSGTRVASTTDPADGSVCGLFTMTASAALQQIYTFPAATNQTSLVFKRKRASNIAATSEIARLYAGATNVLALRPVPDGRLTITVAGTVVYTSTASLPVNAWVRYSLWAKTGTTATTGSVRFDAYIGESTTPIAGLSFTTDTANLGTTALSSYQLVRPGASTDAATEQWDSFRIKTATDAPSQDTAPWAVAAPPTGNPVATNTVTLVGQRSAVTPATSDVFLTLPLPNGTGTDTRAAQVDDLAVLVFSQERGAAGATTPTGWTTIENTSNGTNLTSIKAYRHLTPSDLTAGSITFTTTATRRMAAGLAVFAGAGVPTWQSKAYTANGTSTVTVDSPDTTANAAGLLVSLTTIRSSVAPWTITWAPQTGWTEVIDAGTTSTSNVNAYAHLATKPVTIDGTQAGHVLTGSAADFGYFASSLFVPVGTAPAGAGETQTVEPGALVLLTGTGSGTEPWVQTSGPTVDLNLAGRDATFNAPYTLDGATLTFTRGTGAATVNALRSIRRVLTATGWKPLVRIHLTQLETNPPTENPDTTTLLPVTGLTAVQVAGTRQVRLAWGDPNTPKADSYIVSEDLHGNLNTSVTTLFRQSTDLAPGDYRYTVTPAYTSGATGPGVTITITVTSASGAPTVTAGTPTVGTKTWSVTQTADVAVTAVGQLRLVVDGPVVATYNITTAATTFTESYTALQPGTQYIRTTTFTRADTGASATQSGTFTTQQATATIKYERLGPTLALDTDPIPAGWSDWQKIRVLSASTYTVNDGPTLAYSSGITIASNMNAVVLMPRAASVARRSGGMNIDNGINVAVRGGEAARDDLWTDAQYNSTVYNQPERKALQIRNFTGHLDVEGLYVHGAQILDDLWVNTNSNIYSTGPTKRYMTFQNCLFAQSHAPSLDAQKGLGIWVGKAQHADGVMFIGGEPTQPDGTTIAGRTVVRTYQCMFEGSLQGMIGTTYGFGIELEMERTHFNMTEFNTDGSREPAYALYWGGGAVRIGPEVSVRHARAGWVEPGYPNGAKWAGVTFTTGERIDPAWKATAWTGTRVPGRGYVAD